MLSFVLANRRGPFGNVRRERVTDNVGATHTLAGGQVIELLDQDHG